jgi:hypothetical protein
MMQYKNIVMIMENIKLAIKYLLINFKDTYKTIILNITFGIQFIQK